MQRLSEYLKKTYGEKVYKLTLSSGCSCPNRDGRIMHGGCTFCSEGGSGEFAADAPSLVEQIEEAKALIRKKTDARKFIAYFQSFTNTYGDPGRLRKLYMEAIQQDEVEILSLGTRPDCLGEDIMEMLNELNQIKPVWVELGLQTMHDTTAERVHRGYPLAVFEESYRRLKAAGITVIVHVIFGLPGESREDMLDTIRYLASLTPHLDGIKIQMLQVLKGTQIACEYEADPFPVMNLTEYSDLVAEAVKLLPEETVLHRMTGDGPRDLLIEPRWCLDKKRVLNTMNRKIGW